MKNKSVDEIFKNALKSGEDNGDKKAGIALESNTSKDILKPGMGEHAAETKKETETKKGGVGFKAGL